MRTVEKYGIYDGIRGGRDTRVYEAWRNMLHRCYNERYLEKNPSYRGCEVVEEWKRFSVFKQWFDKNYIDGYQLDKDLLGDGKYYSPETCCFIPKSINVLLTNKQRNNTSGHPGVCFDKWQNNWMVYTKQKGKYVNHGRTNDFDYAVTLYKNARNEYIDRIASEYSFLGHRIVNSIRLKGGYHL